MRLVAKHLPDGGWECVVDDCRFAPEGRKDIETHAEREHGAECFMDDHLDLYDIKELKVEIARSAGAI